MWEWPPERLDDFLPRLEKIWRSAKVSRGHRPNKSNLLGLKKCRLFWPPGGDADNNATIYRNLVGKKSARRRKIIGQMFEMRRCLAILRSSCGGAAGCLTLRISRGRASWKTLYITGSDSREASLQEDGGPGKQTTVGTQTKKNKTQTQTCWNSNSAVWSIKKNKKTKHLAFWEKFSPLSAAKASSLPGADEEDVSGLSESPLSGFSSYRTAFFVNLDQQQVKVC